MLRRAELTILGVIALTGCNPVSYQMFASAPGKYTGFLVARSATQSQMNEVTAECEKAGTFGLLCKIQQAPARLQLPEESRSTPAAEPTPGPSPAPAPAITLRITPKGPKSVTVEAGNFFADELVFKGLKDHCFEGPGADGSYRPRHGTDETIYPRLCYDATDLILDTGRALSIVLTRSNPDALPVLETPREYTLDELLVRARDQSYESRLQFQQVIESRVSAFNAHMALLPRLTVGDVLGFASFNWQSLLRSVGNLMPFLLPSRWIRAHGSDLRLDADRMGWMLMRANSANIAEGLGLAILRDTESLQTLEAYLAPLANLQERYRMRERLGISPPGAADDIGSVINSVKRTRLLLGQAVEDEYASLAQASGFLNPRAILKVRAPEGFRFAIENPQAITDDWVRALNETALLRSYELRQIDDLVRQAESERLARYFDWIDPSGANAGIGFVTPGYIIAGRDTVDEMKLRREQLKAVILQKAEDVRSELSGNEAAFGLASETAAIQGRRMDRINASSQMGLPLSLLELQQVLQDKMKAELDVINTRYQYEVASTKLRRVLYLGPYLDLRPPQL